MTTIAYRDAVLAGDSLISSSGVRMGTMPKIARRDDGALCGACGSASHIRALLAWFLAGEDEKVKPAIRDNEAQALIVRPNGQIEWHDDVGHHVVTARFFAIGSGRDIALGAMAAGAGAVDAVRYAAAMDSATGGKVTSVATTRRRK